MPTAPAAHVRRSCHPAYARCDRRRPSAPGVNVEQALGANEEHEEMPAPDEEAQPQRSIRTAAIPSAEELSEHCDNGHIPYRDWCPDCNEAFGRERAHKGTDCLHKRLVPLISCDYLFITQKRILSR